MNRDGFVLIAALWLLLAIAALALDLALDGRALRLGTLNTADRVRARLAAESDLDVLRFVLDRRLREDDDPWFKRDPWAGVEQLIAEATSLGASSSLTLRDQAAVLDVNRIDAYRLMRLLSALDLTHEQAAALRDAILDWRDSDDFPRADGAERDWYVAEGSFTLPANRPFQRIEDLRDVRGMSDSLFAVVAPLLTVRGGALVNVNAASGPVLLTLPGFNDEAVQALLARRAAGRPVASVYELSLELSASSRAALLADLPRLLEQTTLQTTTLEVLSTGTVAGSPVRVYVRAGFTITTEGSRIMWKQVS